MASWMGVSRSFTGAGRGIGASVAKMMAREGAAVVVNDLGANSPDWDRRDDRAAFSSVGERDPPPLRRAGVRRRTSRTSRIMRPPKGLSGPRLERISSRLDGS